jgi:outer membrane receptor protein involved in Fe transport
MKNIITLSFLFLFIQVQSFSQRPTGVTPKLGSGNMNMGRYYGKLVEANKKGINGATLQIKGSIFDTLSKKMTERILGTQLSAANGDFSFENLPVMGSLKLTITNIGFTKLEKTLNFNIKMSPGQNMQELMAAVDKDLGNIKLEESANDLQSVTVTSTARPQFEMGIDRKIFNVDKNIMSTGQTAVEVMKSIPNLNVDIDGNVTLRNATPTLLIDNRPTTLTMDQIPADIIDRVEIITNPSAKYDASGGNAGILNIVLKKNKKNGYNGGIRAGVDMRGKFNGGGDLSVRDNKLNFSASANINGRKSVNTNTTVRDILGATMPTQVTTINNSIGNGSFNFYRAGLDYLPDNRNTFSLYGNLMQGNMGSSGSQSIDSVKAGILNQAPYQLTNSNYFDFLNKGAQLSFKHLFAEKGHEITSDFNYNESNSNSWSNINSSFLNQKSNGVGNSKNYTTNIDYAREITDDMKFEAGMRYNFRDEFNSRDQFRNDVFLGSISNKYKYGESIMAEYVNLSGKKGKLSYQLGLRAESRTFTVDVQNHAGVDSLHFKTSLPISFFPSAFVTYKLNDKNDIQINYSKRINAPNFFQLQPFPDYSDPLNITVGNPGLKPQFTHSIELNYNNAYKKGSNLLASVYYKYSTDLITNYIYRAINPTTNDSAYYSSYINANTAVTYGLELSNKTAITKWWDMNLSFNLFNSSIQATTPGQNVNNNLTSWFSKMNNTFKLPKGYSFQFSGQYQAKTILPPGGGSSSGGGRGGMSGGMGGGGGFGGPQSTAQGYNFAYFDFDMAIKKDWTLSGGRTASLSLSVSDVFKTRVNKTYSESQFFVQNAIRIRDQQFFRLNFSYRFGKFDLNLLKRKNNKTEDGGAMDQMQQ